MISKRLLSISSLISDSTVYDIGCDHALLDIYLTLYNNCKCVCIDVDEIKINRAKENINKYGLDSKIKTIIGNGFDNLNIDNSSTMVLSGMGTQTILKIVDKNRTDTIICQTNTDQYDLRVGMCNSGYYISDEKIVYDNNRYYVTIKFKKGSKEYSIKEYLLGPILLKENSDIFKEYVNYLYNKNINAYNKNLEFNKKSYVTRLIDAIKDYR